MDTEKFVTESITHFKSKADHNKSEALWSFRLIMLFSLSTPLLIALCDDFLFGKVVPAVLSMIVALCTTWLQKRQPHQLWKLYRSCQRKIESEAVLYKYEIDDYDDIENKEKMLIKKIMEIKNNSHDSWSKLVPTPDSNDKKQSQKSEL